MFSVRGRIGGVDLALGALAVLCAALAWLLAVTAARDQIAYYLVFAVASTGVALLVFVRRVWVVPAFAATCLLFAAMAVAVFASPKYLSIQPILLFAPISLMAVTEHARAWWWGPVALLLGIVGSVGSPAVRAENFRWALQYHVVVLVVAFAWASRRRAVRTTHERELAAARARERTRIAAELHDVLGHTLAAVRAQASAGLVVAERRGESTAEVLRTVAEISKDALGDVRHLVGLLRDGHDGTAPADSFADLRNTLRRARAAGVAVVDELPPEQTLADWERRWPAAARLAVLRVVREAVTNVIKHAGAGATATVTVTEHAGTCTVVVDNTGAAPTDLDGGRGLAGLRERMSSVGGALEVGPTGRGVRLRATLPVTPLPHSARTDDAAAPAPPR